MKKTVLAAGLLAAALRAGAEAPAVYALVGARVLPVSHAPLEKGTVVLRDGLIVAVGETVSVPPDARVIDASGLTLTPGIIDGFGGIGLLPRSREAGEALPSPAQGSGPLAADAWLIGPRQR